MRIALISTLATPVRPTHSGSVEAVVWLLGQELTRLGHEVTVFGAAGSEVSGSLVATLPGPYASGGAPEDWHLCEILNLCKALEMSGRFDVLHSHAYLRGLPLEPLSRAPMLHTLHTTPHTDEAFLRRAYPDAWVTAISHYQWSAFDMQPPPVVYHAVDAARFRLVEQPEDYLLYLGRFTPGKGPLTAIEVARRLGMRLLLAGPLNRYYTEKVAPFVDGDLVQYVGSVTGDRRSALLGGARALLYPVAEPEPFGLVMPEAMMCGTPVAALKLGAVPEVVDEGITGYTAESPEELPLHVERALRLDRRRVRAQAEARFSGERMAREYEAIYCALCDRRAGTGTSSDASKRSDGGAP
jgi:glycosyltransferase involved in cell wall biosynthesis